MSGRKKSDAPPLSSQATSPAPRDLVQGVLAGDRTLLSRAITLVESSRHQDRLLAEALLTELLPKSGGSLRVGITGAPGAGKSTFIDRLGTHLTARGHRVAVLAVDPSSEATGGSILGDKTRMERLSTDERAFIRPSPNRGEKGGVAARTRETILLCEAAGHDVVLVETVGVGQSETVVAGMTDVLVVLLLPGSGDELQGMKKGVLELAQVIVIHKADGPQEPLARMLAQQTSSALRLFSAGEGSPRAQVLLCSSTEGRGLAEVWEAIAAEHARLDAKGMLEQKRRGQRKRWLRSHVEEGLIERLKRRRRVDALFAEVEKDVEEGRLPASTGARRILDALEPGA